jgi:hypothetical protein
VYAQLDNLISSLKYWLIVGPYGSIWTYGIKVFLGEVMICCRFAHFFLFILLSGFQTIQPSSTWVFVPGSSRIQAPSIPYAGVAFPTLSSWSAECKKHPQNRNNADSAQHSGFASLGSKDLAWKEFDLVLSSWFKMMQAGPLSQPGLWQISNIGREPKAIFFDTTQIGFFMPFAQKLIAEPRDEFYIRGDLHGDIFSLLMQLETMKNDGVLDDSFRILKHNVWILFLGDYVDRGQYGCEVLYTMLRLSLANPDRVIFVRGNHEDIAVTTRHGFKDEVSHKFNATGENPYQKISRMNDFLPVVLYVGCQDTQNPITIFTNAHLTVYQTNYLQCCHGGLEIGYAPQNFLDDHSTYYQMIGYLNRATFVKNFNKHCDQQMGILGWVSSFVTKNPFEVMKDWWKNLTYSLEDKLLLNHPTHAGSLGFMWNDFDVANREQVRYEHGRGMYYGQQATEKILELSSSILSKICGVFRAHQHGDLDMMHCLKRCRGVYKLWSSFEKQLAPNFRNIHDGKVWTFNVGADSVYGHDFGFNFDAYARLIVQEKLQDWKMQVFNTRVVP